MPKQPNVLQKKTMLDYFPKPKPKVLLDLREVFSADNSATVERVIKYLSYFYFNCSNRPKSEIFQENAVIEEFCLLMPTIDALQSEFQLCQAISAHANGKISDEQIKDALVDFVETHTFVYLLNERICKRGDCRKWDTATTLYLLTNGQDSFVCNPIQRELIKLIESEKEFISVKL